MTRDVDTTRRWMLAAGMMLPMAAPAFARQEEIYSETQRGDPDLDAETVTFSPDTLASLSSAKTRSVFTPKVDSFQTDFLSVGQAFVGSNRWDTEARVSRLLTQFGVPFRDGNGNYVPYCAAGISFCAAMVYLRNAARAASARTAAAAAAGEDAAIAAPDVPDPGFDPDSILDVASDEVGRYMPEVSRYHFYPTVSVVNMFHVALGTRRWKEPGVTAKPGWVVIFDWDRKGSLYSANHCGIVERAADDYLQTIEFNTRFDPAGAGTERDGGWVARRTRRLDATVKGYIDTARANPFW